MDCPYLLDCKVRDLELQVRELKALLADARYYGLDMPGAHDTEVAIDKALEGFAVCVVCNHSLPCRIHPVTEKQDGECGACGKDAHQDACFP